MDLDLSSFKKEKRKNFETRNFESLEIFAQTVWENSRMEFETGRRRRRRRISKDSLISLARAEVREVERISNNSHRSETRFNWKEVYLTGWRWNIFITFVNFIVISLWILSMGNHGSVGITFEMQCMYATIAWPSARVWAAYAPLLRQAFRRALMRTFVPDTLSLCASSGRRLELEAALWLPYIPTVDARGRGSGYGQLRFWLLGLLEVSFYYLL